jgi:hypothetical protein
MTLFLFFALVTATFRPSQPTVGDLVTIRFEGPVVLDPSSNYEVVSQSGAEVVVRTFQPQPFMLSGTVGGVRFRNLQVPVRSVLKPADDLTPAPLKPPQSIPYERTPFVVIAVAALVAAALWFAVFKVAKRVAATPETAGDPLQRFRATVLALRNDSRAPRRWSALADATRAYLAATNPRLGLELTSTQLLAELRGSDDATIVANILHQGDLEKFSPWGATPADFDPLAQSALQLARESTAAEEQAA